MATESKLEASKRQSTNPRVTSTILRPLFIQSLAETKIRWRIGYTSTKSKVLITEGNIHLTRLNLHFFHFYSLFYLLCQTALSEHLKSHFHGYPFKILHSPTTLCARRLMCLTTYLTQYQSQPSSLKWIWKSLFRSDTSRPPPPPLPHLPAILPRALGAAPTTALSWTGSGGRPLMTKTQLPTRTKWTSTSP